MTLDKFETVWKLVEFCLSGNWRNCTPVQFQVCPRHCKVVRAVIAALCYWPILRCNNICFSYASMRIFQNNFNYHTSQFVSWFYGNVLWGICRNSIEWVTASLILCVVFVCLDWFLPLVKSVFWNHSPTLQGCHIRNLALISIWVEWTLCWSSSILGSVIICDTESLWSTFFLRLCVCWNCTSLPISNKKDWRVDKVRKWPDWSQSSMLLSTQGLIKSSDCTGWSTCWWARHILTCQKLYNVVTS